MGISEVVGRAYLDSRRHVLIHRALRPLACGACEETIGEGDLFTRRRREGGGLGVSPCCAKCAPFDAETPSAPGASKGEESRRRRSHLRLLKR